MNMKMTPKGNTKLETWRPTGLVPEMDRGRAKFLFEVGLTLYALRNLGREASEDDVGERMREIYCDETPEEDRTRFFMAMVELGLDAENMSMMN